MNWHWLLEILKTILSRYVVASQSQEPQISASKFSSTIR
jgi:hypothetical protein